MGSFTLILEKILQLDQYAFERPWESPALFCLIEEDIQPWGFPVVRF